MDRRTFTYTLAASLVGATRARGQTGTVPSTAGTSPALFVSADPQLVQFAEHIFRREVLLTIQPPRGMVKHRWISVCPQCTLYPSITGLWDHQFVADLLALLPEQRDFLRDAYQNYWDLQARWSAARSYAHGMVAQFIDPNDSTNWLNYPAYTNSPLIAWGVERVYRRNGDTELLRRCIGPLEQYHEWCWRERDVTNVGLIAVGAYSGDVQHARYETYDFSADLDDLQLTRHPTRKGPGEGAWYGDICIPGSTSYVVLSERCLARLATIMGDHAMAARRRKRIEVAVRAMREHMWDEEQGIFLAVKRDTLEKVRVATIGGWMPLLAEVPTPAMAQRMATVFHTDHWQTPLPVPTVDRKDPRYGSSNMWRGDVWPPTNYQVATGFAQYGYRQLAAEIADKSVSAALTYGVNERYDSMTGQPCGDAGIPMSCVLLTMILDGLCSQYHLKVRAPAAGQAVPTFVED